MTCFRTNTKNISWKMCYSWFRLYFFCPSVLAIQKTYRKNASDFYLGKQELQTSLEVSYKNFANNGLYWLQFLNLWCAMTKHNSSFLFKVFAVLKYIYKYIQVFFFYFFRISRCWDRVQGSPWRINYRSTPQNYNGRHKVRLPPTVS